MKKKILIGLLAALCVCTTACGTKKEQESSAEENSVEESSTEENTQSEEETSVEEKSPDQYLSNYNLTDYVTLGDYKNVEIDVEDELPEITEEQLQESLDQLCESNAETKTVEDRSVQEGDIVNIDFEGKIDGVAFDGGTSTGYDLTIGSHQFIDGFEDGCIGMEIGETRDVETVFPDPYPNNTDLAGKTAIFTVKVNSISVSEVPELSDELVVAQGLEGVSTIEDYKAYVTKQLNEQNAAEIEDNKRSAALDAVSTLCEFKEPPEPVVDRIYDSILEYMTSISSMYGVDIGQYVAYSYGGEAEDYEETLRKSAEEIVKQDIMLKAIADAEGITISEEELDEKLTEAASNYGQTLEAYKQVIDTEAYEEYLLTEKVLSFLGENATVVHK